MTDEERLKASIEQIYTYGGSQYPEWRVAAIKSIQKILVNLDEFYADLLPELEMEYAQRDIVHCQIRNGWFYEAVSQAEQAIEDLFSLMMNLDDMAYFAKNVVRYNATRVKDYIWAFKADDLEYLCKQFGVPYFSLDDPWEKAEVFTVYRESVLLTQEYLKELQTFHKKYYQDYCQYKHGLSVALTPMQKPRMKGDDGELLDEHLLENSLQTFQQGTVEQYEKRAGGLPAIGILLKPGTQHHIRELHDEGNLLFFTMHYVDLKEVIMVTEHACILLNTLWKNIIWRCEETDDDEIRRVAFPTRNLHHVYEIGFPRDE